MQNVELTQLLVNFVKQLATDPQAALQFVTNPNGELVAQGVTEHDLSGLDMPAIVQQACGDPGFPAEARTALQSYTSGGGGGGGGGQYTPPSHPVTSGPQSMEQVVQHLTYVTQVTNDNDIINEIVDQSTNIEVGDDFDGNIDVDTNNAFADGDGAVAVGEADDVNVATGENSQAVNDSTIGNNQVNSEGAVAAGDDIDAPVVTGTNTGIVADGDVEDSIVGNDNQQQANDVDVDGDNDGVINFGDGDVTNINDSTIDDASIGGGTNVSDNELDEGSAIGTGAGDVSASNEETDIDAEDSVVSTEQGAGDQDTDFEQDFDVPAQPVRQLLEEEPQRIDAPVDDPADAPA